MVIYFLRMSFFEIIFLDRKLLLSTLFKNYYFIMMVTSWSFPIFAFVMFVLSHNKNIAWPHILMENHRDIADKTTQQVLSNANCSLNKNSFILLRDANIYHSSADDFHSFMSLRYTPHIPLMFLLFVYLYLFSHHAKKKNRSLYLLCPYIQINKQHTFFYKPIWFSSEKKLFFSQLRNIIQFFISFIYEIHAFLSRKFNCLLFYMDKYDELK